MSTQPLTQVSQQIRQKKDRIDAIITAYSRNADGGYEGQDKIIAQWSGKAKKIIIAGALIPPSVEGQGEASGYEYLTSKDPNPSLVESLSEYVKRGGPDEVAVICAPNALLTGDQSKVFAFVETALMQRAWAGFINVEGMPLSTAPDAFVVSGYVLQYVIKDIPDTLTFMTTTWAKWLSTWFIKHLQPNRYFDATSLGLLSVPQKPDVIKPQDAPPRAVLEPQQAPEPEKDTQVAPEPQKAPESTPAKVKRPRGRPKGWRKNKTPVPVLA
jgi:hypothetical protein